MYNIGIIGLGFLGGSLAKSLVKLDIVEEIIAYDTNISSLELAKKDGVITDFAEEINEKFLKCDIIFISTPVKTISKIAKKLVGVTNENCIITDTGSTKKTIIESTKNLGREFIGGHPMVGSERVRI